MKGISGWMFKPYTRPIDAPAPYIVQILPREGGFCFDWLDAREHAGVYKVCYRRRGSDERFCEKVISDGPVTVNGLPDDTEYEFYIRSEDGVKSKTRIALTGRLPDGVTGVDYLHPLDDIYEYSGHALCAPTILKLPSGKLLVSTSVCCDRTRWPSDPCLDILFKSDDNGESWRYVGDIRPAFNSKLFYHGGRVYMLTLSTDYSSLIIGCSEDEGETWSRPVTLLVGEGVRRWGWHRGSYPIVEKDGYLFTAIEYGHVEEIYSPTEAELTNAYAPSEKAVSFEYRTLMGGADKDGRPKAYDLAHYIGVLSVKADSDLMDPANWSVNELYYPDEDPRQCIEGNIVELPDGKLYNLIRTMIYGKSLLLKLDEKAPSNGRMTMIETVEDFPLSAVSKFVIKKDEVTGKYIAFGNLCDKKEPCGRSILAMAVSKDFKSWNVPYVVAGERGSSNAYTYPDWIIDGEDILLVSRTAWNGAVNQHDTNMITFHRIMGFRKYL